MDLARLAALMSPGTADRLVVALERQATALERLAELGEVALGLDPPTLAAAAAAAANTGTVEIGEVDRAALRKIEEITLSLASAMGRPPSDEEIHAELDRQEAVEAEAARRAALWGGPGGIQ